MALDPNLPGAVLLGLSITAEHLVARARGRQVYELGSTLSAIGTTLGQLAVQAVLGLGVVSAYAVLVDTLAIAAWPEGPLGWGLAFAAGELTFYWRHRLGHTVHLFWCVHAVHHQALDHNLATAQRIGWLQWAQTLACAWPLAVLGLPAPQFATVLAVIHFYNFLVHTTLIGRMGWLEAVLVTPSHHRVHHGRNPRYLDRNFGFTTILLDRWFGTFEPETEPVLYGTSDGLESFAPIANNLRPWSVMFARMQAAPSWWTAAQVPWRHPSWNPGSGRVELPDRSSPPSPVLAPSTVGSPLLRAGLVVEMGLAVLLTLWLVQGTTTWPVELRLLTGVAIVALGAGVGLLDGEPEAR